MRLLKENAAALFIDYQTKLVPAMSEGDAFIKNSSILASGLIALGVPIIVSEQYPKGLGNTVESLTSINGFPTPIEKMTFSCIDTLEILSAIKETGKKHIIVAGCEAHVCVLQSVVDLLEKGYTVSLVCDCITSRRENDKKYGIDRALSEGAYAATYEAVLFELQRKANGDTFKIISSLVK